MALFGYQNALDNTATTLAPSSAADGFSAENLRIPQGSAIGASSVAWQTPFGVTAASLLIAAPAAVSWRAACLSRTNLTTSATMRVRVGAYDSGTISAGVAFGIGQALHLMPAAVSALAMQIDIADPTNPDGLLNIPLCYAGPCIEAAISMGTDYGLEPKRDDAEMRGGTVFATYLAKRRGWALRLDVIRDADIGWLDALETIAAQGGNILFVPLPNSARASSEAVLGMLTPGRRGFVDRVAAFRSWSASILERL
ncbi:hypothetical protein [Sediminicoccus sp. KRV36]|uniref:hypothetical protein n=1 Tax=Sediminicoccus sp. KRV36 TaxID=3133721 RepID=UPI00200DA561|nr:hypothetical protein [Sediminicoccus rosea]UPY35491.1 hypothetical protein LHU95_14830 [Sediminicoccus rosea]